MKSIIGRYCTSCLILLTACSSTAGFERADQMKRYLTERLPTGTKLEVAKQVLQSEGFQVALRATSDFVEEGELRRNIDYLYGDRSDGFLVSRRWQVAVVLQKDKVTEILVSTDLIDP